VGGLTDFLRKVPAEFQTRETFRWYRSQMRAWALDWRDRRASAAILALPVEQVAGTYLTLAIMYRDEGRRAA
jgi:hypothetical protein